MRKELHTTFFLFFAHDERVIDAFKVGVIVEVVSSHFIGVSKGHKMGMF